MLKRIGEIFFRKKEQLSTQGQIWLSRLISGKYGFNKKLIEDIYQEKVLTPHEEMRECRNLYLTNSLIVTGVEVLKDVLIGDKLSVESNQKATVDFFEEFFENSGFIFALTEAVENFIIVGNGYIEKLGSITNKNQILSFKALPLPELIWKDMKNGKLQRYILEVPTPEQTEGVGWHTITYLGRPQRIRGIEIQPNKLIHLKYGIGAFSEYGRSPLASSINDAKILREMERAYAIISRYKAVPRKVIRFLNEDGTDISPEERLELENNLNNLEDFENPIVNKKVEIQDLSYAGKEINLAQVMDYLKTKQTLPLAPSFYILGQETNYAVAHDQKDLFMLRVKHLRRMISNAINPILQQIALQNNLDPEVKLKFGEFSFDTEDDKVNRILRKFQSGVISLEEARKELGYKKPKEGDTFRNPSSLPFLPSENENQSQ